MNFWEFLDRNGVAIIGIIAVAAVIIAMIISLR